MAANMMNGLSFVASSSSSPQQHWQKCEAKGEELFVSGQSSERVAAVGEMEEERKLAEQSCDDFYYKRIKIIRVLMMMMSVRLVSSQANDRQPVNSDDQEARRKSRALQNVLQTVAVWPKCCAKDRKPGASWFHRIVWPPMIGLFTALYLHYAFVKLLPLSILTLKRHYILRHLKPSVQPHALRTNSCALSKDVYFTTPADQAQFELLKSLGAWLKFFGMSVASLPEFGVSSLFLMAVLPLAYYYMYRLVLSLRIHRADALCFLVDPLGERRRIGAELSNIVRAVTLSQLNTREERLRYDSGGLTRLVRDDSNLVIGSGRHSGQQRLKKNAGHGSIGKCSRLAALNTRGKLLSDEKARRLRYLQTLVQIKHLKQVDPYIVTSKWHKTLLYRTDLLLKTFIYVVIVIAPMIQLAILLYDLCDATRLRLAMVECTKWRPQGGTRWVALDHLYLDELGSEEQLNAYKTHDGSTLSFLKLALFVESTSYFSLRRVICWCDTLVIAYVFSLQCYLSATLHLVSTTEKIVWLKQLSHQIERAADQAAEHAYLARRFGPTHEHDERLLNTLTIVYLNYELFRRQHDKYLIITDPISTCLTLLSMIGCLIIFFSGVTLGTSSPVLIFSFWAPLLAFINLFLVASAYRLRQVEKIMTKATRILAHCLSSPVKFSPQVELWRRQVRAEDTCQQYASRLFGIPVTYNTVLTLNGYAIALLLILLKPQLGSFR